VLFCIPWLGKTLVGTTETPVDRADLEPEAMEAEIDFVLETAGAYLEKKPTRDDILSVFAGIRPLARSGAVKNTSALSRGHMIEIDAAGMLTITGGKWTTYRRMAEDAVDQAMNLARLAATPSVTENLAIAGPAVTEGDGERLHTNLPYTAADVIRAVRDEMAQTVEDVLARRTRALLLNARAAIATAPSVAAIMAAEMGKDETWAAAEVAKFTKIAENYLGRSPAARD
jgi:glycerol-3-phosphate dehydrogenase